MRLAKLDVLLPEHEVCERVILLLRSKVPGYLVITSVTIDGNLLTIRVRNEKFITIDFFVTLSISSGCDGDCVYLRLEDCTLGARIMNSIIAACVPEMPGIEYSWSGKRLVVRVPSILERFGIDMAGHITGLSFNNGIRIQIS